MILTYNTSLADLHLGLFSDDASVLAEFHHITSAGERGVHDAMLAQKTSDLLKEISASPKEISRIVFINGPGSFTGLRIGLAFAKGMAFGNPDITLIPLIAHAVLLKQFRESRTTNHESRLPILYPGYAKDFVYISYSDEPEKIAYMKISDLLESGITECICTSELDGIAIPHHLVDISLETMAEMSDSGADFSPLSELEPFYGTDFKPTI
jgi:tRNA threonylcarbamoyl adenosine modification protein YeaZ